MASVWGELKRRNVVRVAVAYVIVGWLILQFADVLVPLLALPEWVGRLIFLLLLVGLPLALFLAWAYELTPEGLKKEKDVEHSESITHITGRKLDFVIIGVLLVALALFAVERFVLLPDPAPAIEAPKEIAAIEFQHSIAVLPFVNMSPDPDQEYFSDGLSEEILNLLTKIPELKVIGRTSSFAFKGKNTDLRDIGKTLGVKTLLEGSVRKSGDRVRITVQLIDVSDGAHIWSETYDRTMTDIFAVQDDVAAAIIDALQIHVSANPTRGRPTENTEAYVLFLRAKALFTTSGWLQVTEGFLLQAVELDPKFAEAYEWLAYVYWRQAGQFVTFAEAQKLTGEAAAKALAIDPDLAFAQALYQVGNIETYSHLAEIEAFERVVREQPSNTAPVDALIPVLIIAGYFREALGFAERLVELEPLSSQANSRFSDALYPVGRTNEAMAALELSHQLGRDRSNWDIGQVNLVEKRDDIAIVHFEAYLQRHNYPDSTWVRELVTGARDPVTGQAYLDRRIPEIVASMPEEEAYGWQMDLTKWYLYLGFLDRYFELILDLDRTDSIWTDADDFVWAGSVFRQFSLSTRPKYLDVSESMGIIDIW